MRFFLTVAASSSDDSASSDFHHVGNSFRPPIDASIASLGGSHRAGLSGTGILSTLSFTSFDAPKHVNSKGGDAW
jgi:hypothetical protein